MKTYLLDDDGDLYIKSGKSFFLEGDSAKVQNINNNLMTGLGEIFTDSEVGMPLQVLTNKSVSLSIKLTIIKDKLLSFAYVKAIKSFTYTSDSVNRILYIDTTLQLIDDSILSYSNEVEV